MRKKISRIFGNIVKKEYPSFLQHFINKCYVNYFNIDLSDFKDYKEYKSLLELFTRRLVKERKLPSSEFISPCDGCILSYGVSSDFKAFSIKNKEYDIIELLGFKPNKQMNFLNIYLSPKDYHNYHSPCNMQILSARYFCAELFSVNLKALSLHENLYSRNERVVLECLSDDKSKFYMVFVGAVNVGKMEFDFDTSIKTNMPNGADFLKEYDNVYLQKGQMLGRFLMGSTILILSSDFSFDVNEGKISFADEIKIIK
ncbi:phosphatidylserine decarboxylase [Campylobacter canadensis]|uniref:phosphatidylserine decarboxylase n=1 Tax=Campylobacter canadensis TaxID=449520 RepID=A0ABS7WQH2_9BACT|nr:phosphatidylserine decarboxylase [Campylobacter canadensis]MBZ7987011.1 phosphatidylserine decarboxylase [Campylobacter canadensis]MBZ7998047.1 phosphatidylserine decarboxylase [Campylobacter canadensis]